MIQKSHSILLLTASIDPGISNTPMTFINSPTERLQQYRDNIERLLTNSNFDVIIFCENTEYYYDYSALKNLADKHHKTLETLIFKGNIKKIENCGKGYGEGEIIKYAIENSNYLRPDSVFYKLTGRLYVDNINELLLKDVEKENCFIKFKYNRPMTDTRFFKSSVSFFKENLILAYENVDDRNGRFLEMVYFDKLKHNPKIYTFSNYPKIQGLSGSTGMKYDLSFFKYTAYQTCLKLGLLRVK